MATSYSIFLTIHVVTGFIGLVLFWIPIVAKKGSKRHVRTGRWYTNAMYVVSGSALILSVMLIVDPLSFKFPDHQFSAQEAENVIKRVNSFGVFLFSIAILVVANLRHGILTIKAKKDHHLLRSPSHLALNGMLVCAALYLASIASDTDGETILFYVFAGICAFTGLGNLRYSLKKQVDAMEWLIAHLGSMLGAGIALHTAFFVFGGSRFIAELLTGQWMLIPWIGPGVIGSLAIAWLSSKYRNKYRHLRERAQPGVSASA